MKTRVQKIGDSLAMVIPPTVAAAVGLSENVELDVTSENGAMVARTLPRPTLDELLAGITDENRHGETDTGGPVGGEAW